MGGPCHRARRHATGDRHVADPRRPRQARADAVPHAGGGQHRATSGPPANALGIRRIMFAVDNIDDVLARLRAHGAELVGEVALYEDSYRLCYIRGPEGIIFGLAEPIG